MVDDVGLEYCIHGWLPFIDGKGKVFVEAVHVRSIMRLVAHMGHRV